MHVLYIIVSALLTNLSKYSVYYPVRREDKLVFILLFLTLFLLFDLHKILNSLDCAYRTLNILSNGTLIEGSFFPLKNN